MSASEGTAQLSSLVSDIHGAMLKPRRSKQDDSPMSGFEKHSVRRKCKFPSGFRFSYSSSKHVHNCGVKMESGKLLLFFFQKAQSVQNRHMRQSTLTDALLSHGVNPFEGFCRNPTLAKCEGEAQHLEKLRVGVLQDSRMFRARQQGSKHLALECSWCRWKGLET
jgi:hypothetical protein